MQGPGKQDMKQDKLGSLISELKETGQRASRVKARRAKSTGRYKTDRRLRNGALKPTLIKEVGGSRLRCTQRMTRQIQEVHR